MKELLALSAMSYVDDDLIEESAALLSPPLKVRRSKGRGILAGAMIFLGSGWCVAAVCFAVSVGLIAGMIWMVNQPFDPWLPPAGSGESTSDETDPSVTEPDSPPDESESADPADPETNPSDTEPESGTESAFHPEITEGGVTFISLGDGTCKVKGADPSATGKITVPSVSPYGDVVTTVATGAFKGFREIKAVSLPDTVKIIGGSAFQGCAALESVELPPELEEFGRAMFTGCGELRSVVLPRGVTEIDAMTFQTCVSLQSVVCEDEITAIGASAFNGCRSLATLTIPGGLKTIGASAFLNCCGLRTVYYGGSSAEWAQVEIHPTDNTYIEWVDVVCGAGEERQRETS